MTSASDFKWPNLAYPLLPNGDMREGLPPGDRVLTAVSVSTPQSTSSRDTRSLRRMDSAVAESLLVKLPSFFLSLVAEAGTGMGPPVPCTAADSEYQ